jgi:hypothetical protein
MQHAPLLLSRASGEVRLSARRECTIRHPAAIRLVVGVEESQLINDLPMFDRAMNMWREVDFPLLAEEAQELNPYLNSLRGTYGNGAVLHKTFSMPEHADLTEFVLLGALHPVYFFERFWRTKSVSAALPYELHDVNFLNTSLFQRVLPVQLPGSLASALVRGGAYGQNVPQARQAVALSSAAAEVLVAGDFDGAMVFISEAAWSEFFHDVAWDYTWLVVQPGRRRIEVLLATDTD